METLKLIISILLGRNTSLLLKDTLEILPAEILVCVWSWCKD